MSVPSTLTAHPYFRTLEAESCRILDRHCIWLKAVAGSLILDQSANDRDVYFIMSGQLRAVHNNARQDLIFNEMKAGSIFGEMAAIEGAPRAASVFAVVDSVVAKMPPQIFIETMYTHRPLCEAVIRTLSERLRAMSSRVSELGAFNVRTRVHAELLRLARKDRDDPRRAIIVTPPNQSELAARINTRRETVSREINAMERSGLIARRRGAIVINDVLKLIAEIQQASSG